MANDTQITVVGNLTADPELRYTQSGVPVANISVASTPRTFDRQSGEWKDGETLFLRGAVWRELGEHVAHSLRKGQQVIVQGNLVQRSYQTNPQDGSQPERRTSIELDVTEIAVSLRYGTTVFTKSAPRNQNAQPAGQVGQQAPQAPVNGYAAPQVQQAPQQGYTAPQAAPQQGYAAPQVQQAPQQVYTPPQGAPQAAPQHAAPGQNMSDDEF